ncbi:XTP/dITP diphosphohydrolase [Dysgonomonas sp. PH5-45]|uniref:non-canonical purine NTP diphosphatase n=1 Tax=unclassified Dysgonomonas TaxID=2630389 RepID=UPI002476AD43|nr:MULTISPECIES: non-canonical purine NTP diphosphatase [unclassified Dysgonomonas]MDH6353817.1 XTP/dITP diphosphohydrolase [Dysgonomonas sp. PH5-45]MDH6386719.1 XTP/dITP diphosphohydrolase [Dysgonomonas sp. PH5-37]
MDSRKKLIFATNNQHKLKEVRAILGSDFEVLGLEGIGCFTDIPETGKTLEENARIKAKYVKDNYHHDCFADDTGLEVEALDNAPGVYSARYAGEGKDPKQNIVKLFSELQDKQNRNARFRTVISLFIGDEEYQFNGVVNGTIISEERGVAGFGYDPVFIPEGYTQTFAQMPDSQKNAISHRALATQKLSAFLRAYRK